mmetsp:Transcript_15268/g.28788  ORF Transcript_15268/g.28788 Transcript_15268/m.28788 type:complete len:139 (-) Transcript_15268:131-547(-)
MRSFAKHVVTSSSFRAKTRLTEVENGIGSLTPRGGRTAGNNLHDHLASLSDFGLLAEKDVCRAPRPRMLVRLKKHSRACPPLRTPRSCQTICQKQARLSVFTETLLGRPPWSTRKHALLQRACLVQKTLGLRRRTFPA